jgi:hypothetical protein
MTALTESQIMAIRCAHADLVGALQAHKSIDYTLHDWKAHALSIEELEAAFEEILETNHE